MPINERDQSLVRVVRHDRVNELPVRCQAAPSRDEVDLHARVFPNMSAIAKCTDLIEVILVSVDLERTVSKVFDAAVWPTDIDFLTYIALAFSPDYT